MNNFLKLISLVVLVFTSCDVEKEPENAKSDRFVEGNKLVSKVLPKTEIDVASEFQFVGKIDFVIKALSEEYDESLRGKPVAEGERFVFASFESHDSKEIKKLFIVQFEGFYEKLDLTYNYDLSNGMQIGDFKYRYNTWFYNSAENINQNPEGESAKTQQLLNQKGLKTKDEVLMSRFVTVVDEARKYEMIIYYLEFAEDHNFNLVDFEAGNYEKNFIDSFENQLVARSLESFKIK
jgi:hypothetical protein